MKFIAIAGLAILGIVATGRPASAQSGVPDFDTALLGLASPAASASIATATAAGVAGVETPEGVEAPEGVDGPEGIEGPETPGDAGPDHQFEGEESGENGSGKPGPGSSGR
jgi:hypothetical protein